jgi:ABC-type Zn uptake system ZnuABC Zn-binding protein ZnuA
MRIVFITALALAAPALQACGSDENGADGATVVATTGVVADLAAQVAGRDAEVEQLIPDSASPHDFQLSAQDRQLLEEADLVIASGAGLEVGIPLDDVSAPRWTLADHAGELRPSDPHVWMDPTRVAQAVPSLAGALAEVDSENADAYRQRAERFARELTALDGELRRTLAAVPPANRELVTSHDSLGYFADRYGFEVIATAFPASGPEAEISASQLADVDDAVRGAGVPAVFASEEDDPEVLRLVADETGVEIEEGLVIESPASAGSYVEMLRHDADLIAAALGT